MGDFNAPFRVSAAVDAGRRTKGPVRSRGFARLARLRILYVMAICLINFASVIVQCGAGACQTTEYKMLSGS